MIQPRLLLAALLVLTACAGQDETEPLVLVSVLPQVEIVSRLTGDGIAVRALIPPGAHPATFEPTLTTLRSVRDARLLVVLGHPAFPFEARWMESLRAERADLRIAAPFTPDLFLAEDPHVWTAPRRVRASVIPLTESLVDAFPDRAEAIRERAARFIAELDVLDADLREILAPVSGRAFAVAHPAWGAFAADYGLIQIAIEHEGKEPGPAEMARTLERLRAAGVHTLYSQPHVSDAAAATLASDLGLSLGVIDPLAPAWEANLRAVAARLAQDLAPVTPALDIRDVSVAFRGVPVLEDITLTLSSSDFVGIIGPNGAGKTVLLRTILGLVRPDRGSVRVFGKAPEDAGGEVAYVPQYARFDLDYPISVSDVVLMGRLSHKRFLRRYSGRDRDAVAAALERVGLGHLAAREVGRLSGGQLQRVLIARALAVQARLLLFDEPTASLDTRMVGEVYDLVADLARDHTVILVSHDIGMLPRYVRSVGCLNRTLHYHASKEITEEMIEAVYGCPVDLLVHKHTHKVVEEHSLMLEAFTYPFFQRALLAGLLVSVACGVIGSWVLVKRIASISGGLAHAAFGGVGLGYLFGFPPLWGAAGFALLSGAGIGVAYARRLSGLDTLIAMVWAVGMALGIVFISWTPGYAPDLMSYLFGSILVVPWSFLVVAAAVDVIVVVGTVIFFREFQAVTFDEEHARTLGVPVERMLAVLLVLTALTVVVLMRVVGAILVIALLTVPAAVARQWTHSLGTMMAAASLIGAICTTGGLMLAYLLSAGFGVDTPTGPLIVLLAAVFYGLSSAAVRLASRRGGADPAIAPNGVSG